MYRAQVRDSGGGVLPDHGSAGLEDRAAAERGRDGGAVEGARLAGDAALHAWNSAGACQVPSAGSRVRDLTQQTCAGLSILLEIKVALYIWTRLRTGCNLQFSGLPYHEGEIFGTP